MLSTVVSNHLISENKTNFLAFCLPSATMNALLIFMRRMNWTRIGLITENTDSYFFNIAKMLLQMAKKKLQYFYISPYIQLLHAAPAIHETVKFNTRVVFISVNIRRATQLICIQCIRKAYYGQTMHGYSTATSWKIIFINSHYVT